MVRCALSHLSTDRWTKKWRVQDGKHHRSRAAGNDFERRYYNFSAFTLFLTAQTLISGTSALISGKNNYLTENGFYRVLWNCQVLLLASSYSDYQSQVKNALYIVSIIAFRIFPQTLIPRRMQRNSDGGESMHKLWKTTTASQSSGDNFEEGKRNATTEGFVVTLTTRLKPWRQLKRRFKKEREKIRIPSSSITNKKEIILFECIF